MISDDFSDDCCYKINTGAPVPSFADCVIQVEDTKVIEIESNVERLVEILVDPTVDLDIRYCLMTLQKIKKINFFSETIFQTNRK